MRRGPPSFRTRRVGAHEQRAMMLRRWPGFTCDLNGGRVSCEGILRPTPLGADYRVRVRYTVGRRPRASVIDPLLRRREQQRDEPIPHTFNDRIPGREEPCLHFRGEFRSDRLLANTILPWLVEWLAHYEVWRATGIWTGGGIEHGDGAKT